MNVMVSRLEKLSGVQLFLVIFAISFVLYGNTLLNDYALDDAIVITKNEFTKQGLSGIKDIFSTESFTGFFGVQKELVAGGRYRPFSIATFAVEYEFFGENPTISHLLNILFYATLGFLIFQVIRLLLFAKVGRQKAFLLAAIVTFVFLIHPVHTEVVANIKGRDEILSLLFSLLAFYWLLKPLPNKVLNAALVAFSFFIGLMSKENAIAFVFIIPAAFWYFHRAGLKRLFYPTILLLIPTLTFLIIRHMVLGGFHSEPVTELMNNPFVAATSGQKMATIFYTWLIYFRLLVFPHPLTFDYYPYHIPLVDFSSAWVIVSLLGILVLLGLFIAGIKKRTLISFSIISFAASFVLMSNLIFSVGTFMNERFMFVPSLFWCLAVVYYLFRLVGKSVLFLQINVKLKYVVLPLVIYAFVFYPLKTIARNAVWKNDLILFTTDVKTSANSAKSNTSAGGKLWEEGKLTKNKRKQAEYYELSEKYLRKAVQIHPKYNDAWVLLGNVLFDSKQAIAVSADCFLNVLQRNPQHSTAKKNIDIVLQKSTDRNLQLQYYQKLIEILPNDYTVNYRLGVLYGRFHNDLQQGIFYLQKAVAINDKKAEALKDLGTAYGMAGQVEKAYDIFKKAIAIDSSDHQIFINLGVSCRQLGKKEEAEAYFARGEALKK